MPVPACPADAGTRPAEAGIAPADDGARPTGARLRAGDARVLPGFALLATLLSLGACGSLQEQAQLGDRECMARVMYFESNRSSDEGMLAVGTVVMNRVQSPRYPKSICDVVGQPRQFADGALSKPVHEGRSYARAEKVADDVLDGARHDGVGDALFFHTAGYSFPYRNMRYVTLAGGNIFYRKQDPGPGQAWPSSTLFAQAHKQGRATMLASAERPVREETTLEEAPPAQAPSARAPVMLAAARPAPAANRAQPAPAAGRPLALASAAPPRAPEPAAAARGAPAVLASARPLDRAVSARPAPVVVLARPGSLQGLNPGAAGGPKGSPIVLASLATRSAPPPPRSVANPPPAKPSKAKVLVASADRAKPAPALAGRAKPIQVAMLADKGVRPPQRPRGRVLADDDD